MPNCEDRRLSPDMAAQRSLRLMLRLQQRRDLRALLDRPVEFRRRERPARLLIGVAEVEQQRFRPFRPDEAQADRQALHQPHRHGEVRIAGDRGEDARAAAANLVAVDRVDLPRRAGGRADQRDDIDCRFSSLSMPFGPAAWKLAARAFL